MPNKDRMMYNVRMDNKVLGNEGNERVVRAVLCAVRTVWCALFY